MIKFWKRKQPAESSAPTPSSPNPTSGEITWDEQAKQGINQALAQAPVPSMLKGRVRRELEKAAENTARAAGRTKVTLEDVMAGMLSKMPANMRQQVEEAMKGGPQELEKLRKKFQKK